MYVYILYTYELSAPGPLKAPPAPRAAAPRGAALGDRGDPSGRRSTPSGHPQRPPRGAGVPVGALAPRGATPRSLAPAALEILHARRACRAWGDISGHQGDITGAPAGPGPPAPRDKVSAAPGHTPGVRRRGAGAAQRPLPGGLGRQSAPFWRLDP
jgi:hypothetical protein